MQLTTRPIGQTIQNPLAWRTRRRQYSGRQYACRRVNRVFPTRTVGISKFLRQAIFSCSCKQEAASIKNLHDTILPDGSFPANLPTLGIKHRLHYITNIRVWDVGIPRRRGTKSPFAPIRHTKANNAGRTACIRSVDLYPLFPISNPVCAETSDPIAEGVFVTRAVVDEL